MYITKMLKDLNQIKTDSKKFDYAIKLVTEVNSMIDKISFNEIEQIMDTLENNKIEVRKCTNCNKIMFDGYVINDGDEYYCTDKCFDLEIGLSKLNTMYKNDEAYWTEFN